MLCHHGTRGSLCQTSLCTAYYRGTQCNRLRRTRAEPSAALIGNDGTALFHHAAYAASYAARSATWQATPLATSGAVPTRQRLDMLNRGLQEQARESRREISYTCDAIMYEQYVFYTTSLGPPVGDSTAMYASP